MHGIDSLGHPLALMTIGWFVGLGVLVARARHRYERATRSVREYRAALRALAETVWRP